MTNKENPWINRGLYAVFAIGMAVSGWFLNQTMTTLQNIEKRVYTLEISEAKETNGKFTNSDWQIAKALLDADKMAIEKRIIRVEESIPVIKESLIRIENAVERSNKQANN